MAVAPWCDPECMAEQIKGDFVYCWKQNPARIAVEKPDWDLIRSEIGNVFDITARHGCPTEILMRDVRTLGFEPENAVRWARIAREEAKRVYG